MHEAELKVGEQAGTSEVGRRHQRGAAVVDGAEEVGLPVEELADVALHLDRRIVQPPVDVGELSGRAARWESREVAIGGEGA